MLAELVKHVPASVKTVQAAFEGLRPGWSYGLVYAAAALHWTNPDGTPPGHDMQWPGTELQRSEWFADVQQFVIERRLTMSARDYVGHLSTISAYLELPPSQQQEVFSQILRVLPETVEMTADITVHLARRRG